MGPSHVMRLHQAEDRASSEQRGRRTRLVTPALALLGLAALALLLVAAGPAAAAEPVTVEPQGATVAPLTEAAQSGQAARQSIADLAASIQSLRLAAPASGTGYGRPSAAEDDVVIYNRADLYWEIHVTLNGKSTPYQIGQQYARAMLRADGWWPSKVYTYLTLAPTQTHVSYKEMVRRATALKQTVSPEVRGYVEGMASVVSDATWGAVNDNDCWALNLFPDVCRPTMCSALGAWGKMTPDGSPILGRNLDWSNDFILPTLNAVTVYHNGAKSFCSLGYIGIWSVISGFNSKGLYAGILDADTGKPYPAITDQHSYPMDLRTALETTGTVEGAAAVMTKNRYCFNHQIVLADKSRVGVLENDQTSTGKYARKVRYDGTPLNPGIPKWETDQAVCAINSFLSLGNDSALFSTKWNAERWDRYRAQIKTVSKVTVPKMKDFLAYGGPDKKYWPYNQLTTMMMVYQPKTGHLEIFMKPRSGDLPDNPRWQSIDVDWGRTMFAGRWVRTWPAPEGWEVTGAEVEAVPGGGVVAAAQLGRETEKAVAVVRFKSDGRVLWSRIIDPAGEDDALLAGLAVSRKAVVIGATATSGEAGRWLIRKYRADGTGGWMKTAGAGAGLEPLGGVAVDGAGNVYAGGGVTPVAGRSLQASPALDWGVRKFSAGGRQLWQRVVASDGGGTEWITDVVRLGGDVVVTGTWAGGGTPYGCTLSAARLAGDGAVRWQTELATAGIAAPLSTGLAARTSGIAVSGLETAGSGSATGFREGGGSCVFRLDPTTGAETWGYDSLPSAPGQVATYRGVAVDDYGNVSAVGDLVSDADGEQGRVSWFDETGGASTTTLGGLTTRGTAVAVDTDARGLIYVAGGLDPEDGPAGMLTSCWEAGGTMRWYTFRDIPECVPFDLDVRGIKVYTVGGAADELVLGKYDTTTAPYTIAYSRR